MKLPALGSIVGTETVSSDLVFKVDNPATGDTICTLTSANAEIVTKAVESSRDTYSNIWRESSLGKRQKLLKSFCNVLSANKDRFAELESCENGVPINIVKQFSASALVKNMEFYASLIDKVSGEVISTTANNALDYVLYVPFGIAAIITAYNTPSLFLGSKAGPALCAGNVVIIKPSPMASLPALLFGELALEAGIPPGVINVIVGDSHTSKLLVSNPDVDIISFTGSKQAGVEVATLAGKNLTPTILELGGKSPSIIFGDADLDAAAFSSALGAFGLSGQACVAASRIYVSRDVYDEFLTKFVSITKHFKIGDPSNPETVLGPLISKEHKQSVVKAVNTLVKHGAQIVTGPEDLTYEGTFMSPTILSSVNDSSELTDLEMFGPVTTVQAFDSEEEAVAKANRTSYGLGAAVWTKDLSRAHRVASKVEAGTVWINTYGTIPHTAPFGGFKDSGYGREGGKWGLYGFLQSKNIYINLA